MIICSQGFGHFVDGINNQDFAVETKTKRMLLVLDGCSGAKFAEVGTRLFAQFYERREGCDNPEKVELNIKETFEEILNMVKPHYKTNEQLEKEFIMENMLFTIIALFDCGDKYIVKMFGDGYIITQNIQGNISYMKFSYGKYPPYYAYKYCGDMKFQNSAFRTYEFKKDIFPRVFIATDGIMPVAKGEIEGFDKIISTQGSAAINSIIRINRQKFYDDVTIGILGK